MMHSGEHTLEGTPDELSRLFRCLPTEFSSALENLKLTNVAEIECRNGRVKFTSRRLLREWKARCNGALRTATFRANGGGDPDRWTAIRVDILRRDDYRCAYCSRKAATVDHVFPKARGGTEDYGNLVACCKPCNKKKSNRTPKEASMSFRKDFNLSILQNSNTPVTLSEYASASASESSVPDGGPGEGKSPPGLPAPPHFPEVALPPRPALTPTDTGHVFWTLKAEIGKHYGRTVATAWQYYEESLLSEISRRSEAQKEWLEIIQLHRKDPRWKKQSVRTLLEGWSESLDKARTYDERKRDQSPEGLNGAQIMLHQKEYERILEAVKKINNSVESHASIRPEDQARKNELIRRKKELQKILGLTI